VVKEKTTSHFSASTWCTSRFGSQSTQSKSTNNHKAHAVNCYSSAVIWQNLVSAILKTIDFFCF